MHQVALDDLAAGTWCVISEGDYFGAKVQLAGKILAVERTADGDYLQIHPLGTDNEDILKVSTTHPGKAFRVHLCPADCGNIEVGEFKIHGKKGYKWTDAVEAPWMRSLEGAGTPRRDPGPDELESLRRLAALEAEKEEDPKEKKDKDKKEKKKEKKPTSSSSGTKKKKKKKKKKEKEKEDTQRIKEGRLPAKAGQKSLEQIFCGTGLDPDRSVRKRVNKKAQKFMAQKKGKGGTSSSSGSSSSSNGEDGGETGLGDSIFDEDTRVRQVSERYPGCLAYDCLRSMRRSLLTTAGEEDEGGTLRPVAFLYYRNILSRRSSGPQAREMINLATSIDLILKGKVAQGLDALLQRLKAQEAVSHGTAWPVAQRIELAQADVASMMGRAELKAAQKDTYEESRTRWMAEKNPQGKKGDNKGGNQGKGGKNDQGKGGKGKQKSGDKTQDKN